jgi:hypothetical protein
MGVRGVNMVRYLVLKLGEDTESLELATVESWHKSYKEAQAYIECLYEYHSAWSRFINKVVEERKFIIVEAIITKEIT